MNLKGLRVRLAGWWFVGSAALILGARLLRRAPPNPAAVLWLIAALLIWAYQNILAFRYLPLHRRTGDSAALPRLGPGINLTLLRGLSLAALAGFWFLDLPGQLFAWIPAGLYTLAALIDYLDGYLARRSGTDSELGERLDMQADGLGLLIAIGLAVRMGKVPWFFLSIGIARYLFVWTQVLLEQFGAGGRDLPESKSRRPIAGLTMGFVSASLWPIVTPAAARLAGTIFLSAFALSFGRDWLVIAGLVDPSSEGYLRTRDAAMRVLIERLPVLVRVLAAITYGLMVWSWLSSGRSELSPVLDSATGTRGALLLALLLITGTLMVAGILARSAAFLQLFPVGLLIAENGLDRVFALALVCAVLILMLGPGSPSIWAPERRLFARRAGGQETGGASATGPGRGD